MATLKANAITTVARLASFLGIATPASGSTKETQLILQINALTSFIHNYLGYDPKSQTYTNEEMDSNGGESLLLGAFPVTTFTSLQVRTSAENEDDWDSVSGDDYHVDNDSGIIYGAGRRRFLGGRRLYRATYTAGFVFDNSSTFLGDTDGADIELAAWMLGAEVYNRGKGGGGIQSESIGDYRVVYKSAMFNNEEIATLLDEYVRGEDVYLATVLTPLHN